MTFVAGRRLTASYLNNTFTASSSDTQDTSGTTTSTTYTATLTGGTACGCTFVAPLSGVVMVINSLGFVDNTTTPRSVCTIRIKTGGTIGSGTDFLAAVDANAAAATNVDDKSQTRVKRVPGLTPGATYNVQQLFKVSSASTATFASKHLAVVPVI